jgi:hypothetical protein
MPYNGTGTFTRLYNWTSDANNSLPISSTKFDAEDNDFASGLSNCLTRDGQGKPTTGLTWSQSLTLNLAADGTPLTVGRIGGSNNPALQVQVADATGVTLNLSTAQLLSLNSAGSIGLTSVTTLAFAAGTTWSVSTGGSTRATLNAAGNLVVNAPNSGTAIAATGVSGAFAMVVTGAASGTSLGLKIVAGVTGGDFPLLVENEAGTPLFDVSASGVILGYGNTANTLVDMTPDSGTFTLTATGFSGAAPTCLATWYRIGRMVVLTMPALGSTTSNSTSFAAAGLPSQLQPATLAAVLPIANVEDNGLTNLAGQAQIVPGSGTITFQIGKTNINANYLTYSATSWTASGTKAIGNATFVYSLQ